MTLKAAQKIAREHGFTLRKTSAGDYRINRKGDPESHAVYEASIEDALDSGEAMEANISKGIRKYWVM